MAYGQNAHSCDPLKSCTYMFSLTNFAQMNLQGLRRNILVDFSVFSFLLNGGNFDIKQACLFTMRKAKQNKENPELLIIVTITIFIK